jgi:hypothetical protein
MACGRPRPVRSSLALGLAGVIALLSAGLASGDGAATVPPPAPVRFWGQVLGPAPTTMQANLVPTGRTTPLATAAVSLTRSATCVYHEAEIAGAEFAALLARAGAPGLPAPRGARSGLRPRTSRSALTGGWGPASPGLSLSYSVDGSPPGDPTGPTTPPGAEIHVLDGNPLHPPPGILTAQINVGAPQAEHASPTATFTAVILWSGSASSAGQVVWTPAGDGSPPVSARMALAAGTPRASVIVRPVPGDSFPARWSVEWIPDDRGQPRLYRGLEARDDLQVVHRALGAGGDGDLPAGRVLSAEGGRVPLSVDRFVVSTMQSVILQLRCLESSADAVRGVLANAALRTGSTTQPGLPLDCAQIVPGAGGCWVRATWLLPDRLDLSAPVLMLGAAGDLPGRWSLHELAVFSRHESATTTM